ncbi:MAG: carboxymuconolactone decarboxylase family protein [Candidatus Omnitrophota bacterium]
MSMLRNAPEINEKFVSWYREIFKDGKISLKSKELIAVAVSVANGCVPCYKHHLEKARQQGWSDDEIREAIAVAEVVSVGRIRNVTLDAEKAK